MDNYKSLLSKDFSEAADIYNKYANLQHDVAYNLVISNTNQIEKSNTILDIGCGTGFIGTEIKNLYPEKTIIQSDIATKMAILAHEKNLIPTFISDMEKLPLSQKTIDMVISSLAIQWGNLEYILSSIRNIIKDTGYVLLSSITNNSFNEIKTTNPDFSFEKALSYEEMENICINSNINNLHVTTYTIKQEFENLKDFFITLKNIGARKKTHKNSAYLGKKFFNDMESKYHSLFPENKTYTISWEIAVIKNF